jgi:hypothetical protein
MVFMLPTLLLIFTGTTLVLLAKLGLPLSMGYHFDLSMTIRCRDVTPLKGGWMSGDSQFSTDFTPDQSDVDPTFTPDIYDRLCA